MTKRPYRRWWQWHFKIKRPKRDGDQTRAIQWTAKATVTKRHPSTGNEQLTETCKRINPVSTAFGRQRPAEGKNRNDYNCKSCEGIHQGQQVCKFKNAKCFVCNTVGDIASVCRKQVVRKNNYVDMEEVASETEISLSNFESEHDNKIESILFKVNINQQELYWNFSDVEYNNKCRNLKIYVVPRGSTELLGKDGLAAFGLDFVNLVDNQELGNGVNNGTADYLSRSPLDQSRTVPARTDSGNYLNFIESIDNPIDADRIRVETGKDPVIDDVLKFKRYTSVEHGCLMWGYCVVIPKILVPDMLREMHNGHQAKNGIRHVTLPPFNPASNDAAEKTVKTFKKARQAALVDLANKGVSVETLISRFSMTY
ncbi:hypothetical protein ILUMI_26557 [Ignelater luminosus]|uniref:Uncharacterized protein n=1 Tax=Ignelater luminosus TaxID=2038154 RepID=A0A8K0C7S8_IGNLU|nr:hypothetical protein ILUMI_26557 [Ignelater luminosus]